MAKIELIQWRDGTFGIRKTRRFCRPQFYTKSGLDHWWTDPDHIRDYAHMTEERAVELFNSLTDTGMPVIKEPQA